MFLHYGQQKKCLSQVKLAFLIFNNFYNASSFEINTCK